jgi:tetratricopeptide (TPR) repeat protein
MNRKAEKVFDSANDLKSSGNLPEALKLYRAVVDLDPSDPRYWLNLGFCLLELRHWAEAIRSLEKGIALKPAYCEADARLSLAEALEASGHLKKAVEQWKIVSKMEPTYPSHDKPIEEAKKRLQRNQR